MYIVKKQLDSFSAAHRLVNGYQGKCKDLHGHDYLAEVELACEQLDETGFVIDFVEIKRICNMWLQRNWDHATLLSEADEALLAFVKHENQRYWLLPNRQNTTVENLTKYLYQQFTKELAEFSPRVTLRSVTMWESGTAKATYYNLSSKCSCVK
jgi:6-pyruvoyltetrahydropterin/6-carboxytetrahydropterin synthase